MQKINNILIGICLIAIIISGYIQYKNRKEEVTTIVNNTQVTQNLIKYLEYQISIGNLTPPPQQ